MSQQPSQSDFQLTLARPISMPAGAHPVLVHLWWRAALGSDRLVQVYVNDELYDVTGEDGQHQVWLLLDRSWPQRIELLAVPRPEVWRVQRSKLMSWKPGFSDVARLLIMRDEQLTVDTQVHLEVDGEALDAGDLWPSNAHRGGFGALFGEAGSGFDAMTGPGLGGGELGRGALGADGTAWQWHQQALEAGQHTLVIEARDAAGQTTAPPVTRELDIDRLPEPPQELNVDSAFTLSWQ